MRLVRWIIAAMVGVILVTAIGGCQSASQVRAAAEANLVEFSASAGLTAVSCVGRDTDQNGRVGCTAKDKVGTLTAIECGYVAGDGCIVDTRTKISEPYRP